MTNTAPLARALVLACLAVLVSRSSAPADEWTWQEHDGQSVALVKNQQVVWQFNYAADEPKPFFHPVALPDGPTVTWNRPPDHVWHHALWFSWKFINGLNYWEPDASGRPEGHTAWSPPTITPRPDHSARIEMDLTYRPAADTVALTEKRIINIAAPDDDGNYYMDWTCRFTAGNEDVLLDRTPLPDEPGGKAYGGYAGLSVRLAKELTDRGADTSEGPVAYSPQSRFRDRARALDYHGLIDGSPLGVAICDHPRNVNHPSPWYSIRSQPMSYFSPAVICFAPHTIKAGESMTLRYRVIIHSGRWNAQRLQKEFARFVDDTP